MSGFVSTYIKPYAKAITAGIVGALVLIAAKIGLNIDDQTTLLVTAVVGGIVNAALTWLSQYAGIVIPHVVLIALLVVAALLSAIDLIEAHGRSLIAWAVLIIAIVLVLQNL